jgi:hypothetical protein
MLYPDIRNKAKYSPKALKKKSKMVAASLTSPQHCSVEMRQEMEMVQSCH